MKKQIPKVGDTVRITKSSNNWCYEMDKYVGLEVEITSIGTGGYGARFESSIRGLNHWSWNFYEGHFELVKKAESVTAEFIFEI